MSKANYKIWSVSIHCPKCNKLIPCKDAQKWYEIDLVFKIKRDENSLVECSACKEKFEFPVEIFPNLLEKSKNSV